MMIAVVELFQGIIQSVTVFPDGQLEAAEKHADWLWDDNEPNPADAGRHNDDVDIWLVGAEIRGHDPSA